MKKFLAIILCLAMMVSVVAVSTFATTEPEYDVLPVTDGEVEEDEYTNVKVYDHANYFSANCFAEGQVVTEYVAHDADYVYFALTYNVELKSCIIRMNGRANVKTDLAASEYIYEFQFEFGADMDTAELNLAGGNFQDVEGFNKENEGEAYGKASKIFEGDEVVATHFEIKILKEAMKRVFEVDSIDYFGYYAQGTTPAPYGYSGTTPLSNIVNGAKFTGNNNVDARGNWRGGSTEICSAYGLDGTYFLNNYRFMNFVVFGEEPTTHNLYCPLDLPETPCRCTRHAERAEVMDLTDTVNLGTLKSNYVTEMLVGPPAATTTEASSSEPAQSSSEPAQSSSEPAQSSSEPAQSSSEPAQSSSEPAQSSSEPAQSSSEPAQSSDEPTTAEPTTAEPTTAEPTTAATTKAATTAATTAAEEKGCGKSIALSALAIVPVLGLGVAVVSKKKED